MEYESQEKRLRLIPNSLFPHKTARRAHREKLLDLYAVSSPWG